MKDVNILKNAGVNVDASLEVLGDMEMYDETVNDFLAEVDEKLNLLKQYKEANDMPNYAIYAHSLKSDARYLGFTSLAEIALNHEMEGKANNSAFVMAHYDELVNETNKYINLCKTYLGMVQTQTVVSAPVSAKSILIADDSNIIRNLIQKMVGEGYNILAAQDGQEAINIIDSYQGTLVGMFLDLNMPNINGFEVLNHLKSNNLFGKLPVAIITGDDSKDTIMKAFDYPIVDVLAKPFNENDVNRILEAMINR